MFLCWSLAKPAAFDLVVVSPLKVENLEAAGDLDVVADAESKKLHDNGPRCADEGWECLPLAVDSYGRWGATAHSAFDTIATRLSVRTKVSFSAALSSLFNSLGLSLARFNARSILARVAPRAQLGAREVHLLSALRS